MNRNKKETGITLIELLVVMVIIAMFATIVGQRLFRNVEKARQTTAKAQINEFESVLDAFKLDVGRYPTTDEGLQSLRVRPGSMERWDGPYLKKDIPPDPWQRPYIYRFPSQHGGDYDLYSLGADGQEGGDGENADVTSWK
jgi:general secretion pathway protein G